MPNENVIEQTPGSVDGQNHAQEGEVDVWDEGFDIDSYEPTEGRSEAIEGDKTPQEGQPLTEGENPLKSDDTQEHDPGSEDNGEEEIDRQKLEELYRSQESLSLEKPIVVKYKGKYIDISDAKELKDLAERGIMATQKAQELSEYKRMMDGLTPEDIELLKRARSGDEKAIEALVNKGPVAQNPEPVRQAEEIAQEIINQPYADQFRQTMSLVPPEQKQAFVENPQLLAALKKDFDDGVAQRLMPIVERNIAVRGMDFFSAYRDAVLTNQSRGSGAGQTMDKRAMEMSAMPHPGSSTNERPASKDVWDMDRDEFEKLMRRAR